VSVRTRRARITGAVFLALTLAACGPGVPPQQNYATIYGTVYDGTTGQPLAGATVTVDSVLTATTAADGTFTIPDVPLGPYTAVESANGFQQHEDQGTVAAGDRLLLNVTLYK
jgi:hypothetical protein